MIKLVKSVLLAIPEVDKEGKLTSKMTSNMYKPDITFIDVDALTFEEAVAGITPNQVLHHEVTINRYKHNIPHGYAVYYLQDDWT